ncbi:MAG: hypothetical protein WB680_18300, partial [Candidatus Acidiferrales bacterium]
WKRLARAPQISEFGRLNSTATSSGDLLRVLTGTETPKLSRYSAAIKHAKPSTVGQFQITAQIERGSILTVSTRETL